MLKKDTLSLGLVAGAFILALVACNSSSPGPETEPTVHAASSVTKPQQPTVTPIPTVIETTVSSTPPLVDTAVVPTLATPSTEVDVQRPVSSSTGDTSYRDAPLPLSLFLDGWEESAAHIIFRGIFLPNTIRCDAGYSYQRPQYSGPEFGNASYDWTFEDSSILHCFADARVDEYLLGSGPSVLTVQVLFDFFLPHDGGLETLEYIAGLWEQALNVGGHTISREAASNPLLYDYFPYFVDAEPIVNLDGVLFIGPLRDNSVESWSIVSWWEVEEKDDGSIMVIHPDRDLFADVDTYASEVELTIPAFKRAVAAAHTARVNANGGRTRPNPDYPMLLSNASNLRDYFVEAGAYDEPAKPPEQPPDVYSCDDASAVADSESNRGLVRDCDTLLAVKDALRGTASLNWSRSTAIASWEGVTVAGTPDRVTKVALPNESLTGVLPDGMGDLLGLTHLDLSGNSLTGSIPLTLGQLGHLTTLKLSGNALTGCIPPGLNAIATNDLSQLTLLDCPPAPSNPSAGTTGEASVTFTWSAVANNSKYRVEYHRGKAFASALDLRDDWTIAAEVPTGPSHTVTDLV